MTSHDEANVIHQTLRGGGTKLVDDYSVSQTTLEQVFVRFASKQAEVGPSKHSTSAWSVSK
jgi:hypothetical protein